MEIFKSLANIKNAEVTTNVVKENVYPELNGTIAINKGVYSVEFTWWGRVSIMNKMENYVSMEDLEFETNSEIIEGLPIDNFAKFRQGLIDHGMQSVSDSLTIDNDEVRKEIYKSISTHKYYIALFGDKIFFNSLSEDEKKKAYVKAIIDDNSFMENHNWLKIRMGWVKENEEGNEVPLTNQEIIELYK